ncbi:serine hydrolase [Pseudomonas sp. 9Ag]|uniref:serine hydrolase n=1 Tax=Pseudomonas sp. 9Ag TaxID=2653167 RepID=UPI0021150A62|nr:serine hydrolase [Pseudomonas sp. 9Ag]
MLAERGYRGHRTNSPTNIKSASKTILSALVGIAIDKAVLSGTDQPIADLIGGDFPAKPDARLLQVTVGNLLSMQAGLGSPQGLIMGYGWRVRTGYARHWRDRLRLSLARQ